MAAINKISHTSTDGIREIVNYAIGERSDVTFIYEIQLLQFSRGK